MAFVLRCVVLWLTLSSTSFANELKIVVGSATGGVMINARLVAKHLSKYTSDEVSIKLVPGAAGITAANYLYSLSPKDGSEIGAIDAKVFVAGAFKEENAKFDLTKLEWLGSVVDGRKEPYVLWAKTDAKFLISGSEGGFSINHVKLLNGVLGWDIKHVVGYSDPAQVRLAFEKGEINLVSFGLTGVRTNTPHWLSDPSIRPIVQYGSGRIRHYTLQSTPTVMELVKTNDEMELVEAFERLFVLARAFAAPPSVSEVRLSRLRNMFELLVSDPDYQADAAKVGVVVSPVSWLEAKELIQQMSNVSAHTTSRLKQF